MREGASRPLTGEQAAAQRSVERAFPAVAAFLASGDARPVADVMRVDAVQVRTGPGGGHGRAAAVASPEVMRGHGTVMRPDVGQVAEPRTVAVPLLDVPGATLTVTCPQWCVTDHGLDVMRGVLAADFTHLGPWADLDPSEDDQPVLSVRIEQRPFSTECPGPVACTSPVAGQGGDDLAPDQVYALADQLRAFADVLDDLGVDLDDARRTAREGHGRGEGQ